MNDEFQKLESDFQTHMKMTVSLAKILDKLEDEISSIKKSVEGFDGRMLVMAVRIVELQERIETIEESLQHVISHIIKSGNEYKNWDAEVQSSKQPERQSILRTVEYEQAISQFILKLKDKGKGSVPK